MRLTRVCSFRAGTWPVRHTLAATTRQLVHIRRRLRMASQSHTPAHAADVEVLVRRSMTKGYELFSLLTPPAYIAFVLARKGKGHLSVNRFLRATWVSGAVGETCSPHACFAL